MNYIHHLFKIGKYSIGIFLPVINIVKSKHFYKFIDLLTEDSNDFESINYLLFRTLEIFYIVLNDNTDTPSLLVPGYNR